MSSHYIEKDTLARALDAAEQNIRLSRRPVTFKVTDGQRVEAANNPAASVIATLQSHGITSVNQMHVALRALFDRAARTKGLFRSSQENRTPARTMARLNPQSAGHRELGRQLSAARVKTVTITAA